MHVLGSNMVCSKISKTFLQGLFKELVESLTGLETPELYDVDYQSMSADVKAEDICEGLKNSVKTWK